MSHCITLLGDFAQKTTFVRRKTFETAVMLAISQFTMGGTFKVALCQALSLTQGSTLELSASKNTKKGVTKAELAVKTETKKRRRSLKYKKIQQSRKDSARR